jgi:hypothetical protein
MIQADALRAAACAASARLILVAIPLWLGLCLGALAVEMPACEQIRAQAKNYTMKQVVALAKRAWLTPEQ